MYTIRKKIKFEMAHQLYDAYTKECCNLHGHSYILELFFSSNTLDSTGMICDFKKIKDKLNSYIAEWDHSVVMSVNMPEEYLTCLTKFNKNLKITKYNPTAENMTKDMFDYIKKLIPSCVKVRLHETDTGYAEYSEDVSSVYDGNETIFDMEGV